MCTLVFVKSYIQYVNLVKKVQKMASFQDLPDEILLKVINYLDINKRIKFGEVSKRMKDISCDKSLWQNMNLSRDGHGHGAGARPCIERAAACACTAIFFILMAAIKRAMYA